MPDAVPPIQTLAEELLLWTLDRTEGFPKVHRFTFGQRLDNATLEVVELVAEARFTGKATRGAVLGRLNVTLERLRVLWRIVLAKRWISEGQARHVHGKINEIGRMAGSWARAAGGVGGNNP